MTKRTIPEHLYTMCGSLSPQSNWTRCTESANCQEVARKSVVNSYFFDQDKVYIGDDVYPLSKGLLELLFKKIPDEKLINDQDLKHSKDILLKSNAHRVQNRPSGRLRTSNVPKSRLISELLGMRGAGLGSNPLKAMTDDLVAKKNESKYDDVEDSPSPKVQNQNDSNKKT